MPPPPSSSSSQQQSDQAALKKMLKLVNSLLSRPDATPFAEPVDWRGLELWDYPKIVKKMMDLGTVKRKLERGLYKNHAECAEDIRLIWYNCQLYNEEESDFWHLSKAFHKKFEDRYKKIQAECKYSSTCACGVLSINRPFLHLTLTTVVFLVGNSTMDGDDTRRSSPATTTTAATAANKNVTKLSMETKSEFASLLVRLNGMELGHVITTLEVHCPEALEDIVVGPSGSSAQVEINVDAIPTEIFLELEAYLQEKVPHKKRKM